MVIKCDYCGELNYFNKTGYCKNCDRALKTKNNKKQYRSNANLLYKSVEIAEFEIDEYYNTAIKRLMTMQGVCRECDLNGTDIEFTCQKDGDLSVRPCTQNYLCYITGKVYPHNDKTKISIELLQKRQKKLALIISIISLVVVIAFITVRSIVSNLTTGDMFITILALFFAVFRALDISNNIKNSSSDLQIMKSEVIKRIKAIEKWYD